MHLLSISGKGMPKSLLYKVFTLGGEKKRKKNLRTRQLYTLVIMNDFMLILLVQMISEGKYCKCFFFIILLCLNYLYFVQTINESVQNGFELPRFLNVFTHTFFSVASSDFPNIFTIKQTNKKGRVNFCFATQPSLSKSTQYSKVIALVPHY